MHYKCNYLIVFLWISFLSADKIWAQEDGEPIVISERVGEKIDCEKKEKFNLFPGELEIKRIKKSEESIKFYKDYINHFEEIQAQKNYVYTNPKTSLYFELLGKYSIVTFNVDYRINKSKAVSLGISDVPTIMYYHFRGKKYRLELGIGFTTYFYQSNIDQVLINSVIGYRYQEKNGIIFRVGFTPFIVTKRTERWRDAPIGIPIPFLGISLGYSL